MKGRITRIFEIWNQRNTEYYKEAFQKLEKEDKIMFNFVAALYPFQWLIFRKMYGFAMGLAAIYMLVQMILYSFFQNSDTSWLFLLAFSGILFVIFGFFGNEIYYKEVKSKITQGYIKFEDYNPIIPMWSILSAVAPSLICYVAYRLFPASKIDVYMSILSWISMSFVIAIPWISDYKEFQLRKSRASVEVKESSVNRFLDKANAEYMAAAFGVLIIFYCFSFVSGMMQYPYKDQRTVDEEVAKIVNDVDGSTSSDLNEAELDALIKDSSSDE